MAKDSIGELNRLLFKDAPKAEQGFGNWVIEPAHKDLVFAMVMYKKYLEEMKLHISIEFMSSQHDQAEGWLWRIHYLPADADDFEWKTVSSDTLEEDEERALLSALVVGMALIEKCMEYAYPYDFETDPNPIEFTD